METYAGLHLTSWLNPLSANRTKWSNTLKQFLRKLQTNCLSVLDHFLGLALKGLKRTLSMNVTFWLIIFFVLPFWKFWDLRVKSSSLWYLILYWLTEANVQRCLKNSCSETFWKISSKILLAWIFYFGKITDNGQEL